MRKRLLQLAVVATILSLWAGVGNAQTLSKPVDIAITVESPTIDPRRETKVRVRIVNHTGRSFKRDEFMLEIHLEKSDQGYPHCIRDQCFVTNSFWLNKFENEQIYVFEVDLTNFYWNDKISSAYSPSHPKNMPEVILPGEYSLFLSYRADVPAVRDQKQFSLDGRSHNVAVKVERRR